MWTYLFSLSYISYNNYILLFDTTSDVQISGLEISAVRTWDQLSVRIISWEPSFQIILFSSSIIQGTWNDVDNSVRQIQRLIEFFSNSNHILHNLPRLLRLSNDELLDLLELMDSEDTPVVFTMSTSFFSETCWSSTIFNWKTAFFNPLISVHRWYWLFRSCN